MDQASAGRGRFIGPATAIMALFAGASPALADHIKNDTAVYSGLDKITGRIIAFKAKMGETVQFGSLQVTSRACFTRPAKEAPQTDSFLEVDEVSSTKEYKRIFSGWMFAASPGLHGLEHPIYDIWLTGCENPGDTIVDAPQAAADDTVATAAPAGSDATPQTPAPAATGAPAPPPVAEAQKPKPKRVVSKPAPRPAAPAAPVVAERREPSQSFFPTSQYPTDVAEPNFVSHGNR